jgi:mycofactocin system glycosyltransferase
MSAGRRFELDAAVRRRDGGRLLIGGTPPRLLRLSQVGARTLDRLLAGAEPEGAAAALATRLERHGLLHPLPGAGADDPGVTAVVPVRDGGERLAGLIRTLAAEGPTIVIDDGSVDGSGARAEAAGACVLRHPTPRGPGAARNAGLAAARTEIVAFLDADCEVAQGWRRGLAGLLAVDPGLALVAPRVRSAPGGSAVAHYEEAASPLDLGPHASLVGVDRRIAYLPSAALVGDRAALLALGGFDERMRFGEDVDLAWRLLAAGRRVRYAPSREVLHRPRSSPAAFVAQRSAYGSSAVPLRRRHGSAVAPLELGIHPTAVWAVAVLQPRAASAALATSVAIIAARGDDRPARLGLAEVAVRGHAAAAAQLSRALLREWLPLSIAAATRSRRFRRILFVAVVIDAAPAWAHAGGPGEMVRATALRTLDRAAYAGGLWRRSLRDRSIGALVPRTNFGRKRDRAPARSAD